MDVDNDPPPQASKMPRAKYTYLERVLLAVYIAQSENRGSSVHYKRLWRYILQIADSKHDTLGPYAKTFIRKAIALLESACILLPDPDKRCTYKLSPKALKAIKTALKRYPSYEYRAVREVLRKFDVISIRVRSGRANAKSRGKGRKRERKPKVNKDVKDGVGTLTPEMYEELIMLRQLRDAAQAAVANNAAASTQVNAEAQTDPQTQTQMVQTIDMGTNPIPTSTSISRSVSPIPQTMHVGVQVEPIPASPSASSAAIPSPRSSPAPGPSQPPPPPPRPSTPITQTASTTLTPPATPSPSHPPATHIPTSAFTSPFTLQSVFSSVSGLVSRALSPSPSPAPADGINRIGPGDGEANSEANAGPSHSRSLPARVGGLFTPDTSPQSVRNGARQVEDASVQPLGDAPLPAFTASLSESVGAGSSNTSSGNDESEEEDVEMVDENAVTIAKTNLNASNPRRLSEAEVKMLKSQKTVFLVSIWRLRKQVKVEEAAKRRCRARARELRAEKASMRRKLLTAESERDQISTELREERVESARKDGLISRLKQAAENMFLLFQRDAGAEEVAGQVDGR